MAISFVGYEATSFPYADLQISVGKPSGIQANDVLVAQIAVLGPSNLTVTPPQGWLSIRSDYTSSGFYQFLFYKVATANEPLSYTWSFSDYVAGYGVVAAYRGVDTSAPVQASAGSVATDTNTIVGPSLDLAASGMLLFFGGVNDWNTGYPVSPPAGMTERYDLSTYTYDFYSYITVMLCDQQVSAGTTGTKIASLDSNAYEVIGQTVGLKDAVVADATIYLNDSGTGVETLVHQGTYILHETFAYKDGSWGIFNMQTNEPTGQDPTAAIDDNLNTYLVLGPFLYLQQEFSSARYIKEIRLYAQNTSSYSAFVQYWTGSAWSTVGYLNPNSPLNWYFYPVNASTTKWRVAIGYGQFTLYEVAALAQYNATDVLEIIKRVEDGGTGADSLAKMVGVEETGAVVDTLGLLIPLVDSSSATDQVSKIPVLADAVSGSDAVSLLVSFADTAQGVDAVGLSHIISDSGSGSETLDATLAFVDAGAGSDTIFTPQKTVAQDDSGSSIDITSYGPLVSTTDSGGASDALWKWLPLEDEGAGAEEWHGTKTERCMDEGVGADAVGTVRYSNDSGAATDTLPGGLMIVDSGAAADNIGRVLSVVTQATTKDTVGLVFTIEDGGQGDDRRIIVPLGGGILVFRDRR